MHHLWSDGGCSPSPVPLELNLSILFDHTTAHFQLLQQVTESKKGVPNLEAMFCLMMFETIKIKRSSKRLRIGFGFHKDEVKAKGLEDSKEKQMSSSSWAFNFYPTKKMKKSNGKKTLRHHWFDIAYSDLEWHIDINSDWFLFIIVPEKPMESARFLINTNRRQLQTKKCGQSVHHSTFVHSNLSSSICSTPIPLKNFMHRSGLVLNNPPLLSYCSIWLVIYIVGKKGHWFSITIRRYAQSDPLSAGLPGLLASSGCGCRLPGRSSSGTADLPAISERAKTRQLKRRDLKEPVGQPVGQPGENHPLQKIDMFPVSPWRGMRFL